MCNVGQMSDVLNCTDMNTVVRSEEMSFSDKVHVRKLEVKVLLSVQRSYWNYFFGPHVVHCTPIMVKKVATKRGEYQGIKRKYSNKKINEKHT